MIRNSLPRAVIFDWDNTLVDSWGAIAEAINFVRVRYGLPFWTQVEILANCTRSARDSFPDWFGDKWEEAWEEYYDYFDKTRKRLGITPLDGATEFLEWLKENKIPALVVSNKSGHYLRQESAHLGWDDYFTALVGAHDAARDKPAREHADHALKLAGLKAGPDIWFIGDSESDIVCARNSECTPVLIGNSDAAQKLGVEYFAANCREIMGWLKRSSLKSGT